MVRVGSLWWAEESSQNFFNIVVKTPGSPSLHSVCCVDSVATPQKKKKKLLACCRRCRERAGRADCRVRWAVDRCGCHAATERRGAYSCRSKRYSIEQCRNARNVGWFHIKAFEPSFITVCVRLRFGNAFFRCMSDCRHMMCDVSLGYWWIRDMICSWTLSGLLAGIHIWRDSVRTAATVVTSLGGCQPLLPRVVCRWADCDRRSVSPAFSDARPSPATPDNALRLYTFQSNNLQPRSSASFSASCGDWPRTTRCRWRAFRMAFEESGTRQIPRVRHTDDARWR